MIRPATRADIPRIVEMAQRFYDASEYPAVFGPMAKESAAGLAIITMDTGILLVADEGGEVVGMVCLFVEPFLFNPERTIASELAWWIEPEHRGGLLAARMLRAVNAACDAIGAIPRMATLAGSPPQARALIERMGYAHTESYYTRAA